MTSLTNQGFIYCDMIYNVLIKQAKAIYQLAYLEFFGVKFLQCIHSRHTRLNLHKNIVPFSIINVTSDLPLFVHMQAEIMKN